MTIASGAAPRIPAIVPTAVASDVASGRASLRAYATADTGRTAVVFLHAGVCDSRMWSNEIAALGAARRVVAFDRRGFGETRAVGEAYANVDDTIAVMDALRVERAVLVGCSNGGRVALDTCFAHRDRVAGLVLVCAAIGGTPWDGQVDPRLAPLYARYEAAEQAHDRATLATLAARIWLDGPLEAEGRVGGDVRALFLDMVGRSLVAPEDEDLAFVPDTAHALLPTVRVPTLVVVGPLDEREVIGMMRHAVATIPQAQALEVPGTAHLPNLERPDVFVPALARFIEALD